MPVCRLWKIMFVYHLHRPVGPVGICNDKAFFLHHCILHLGLFFNDSVFVLKLLSISNKFHLNFPCELLALIFRFAYTVIRSQLHS